MIDPTWKKQSLKVFGGQWDLLEPGDIALDKGAIFAQNVEFVDGRVQTRRGFFPALHSPAGVGSYTSFNWISPTGSWICVVSSAGVIWMTNNRSGVPAESASTSSSANAGVFAPSGARLIVAMARISDGLSVVQGRVLSYKTAFTTSTSFIGVGLNDATIGGTYTGDTPDTYNVVISATGTPDSFQWTKASLNGVFSASIPITGAAQALDNGITVTFGATTGHTLNDQWGREVRTLTSDKLFSPPITYGSAVTPTEPSAGRITAGMHRLGYIIETRSGFIGRPSPDSGSGTPGVDITFTPVEFTAAGSKNLSWALTTTWPADAVKLHLIMTPVSEPSHYYFVPGATNDVVGGASSTETFVIDISDEELIFTGQDASEHLLLYTQTTGGTGPFNPYFVFPFGDRMVYLGRVTDSSGREYSAAFASHRNAHQEISLRLNLFTSPGQVDMVAGFALGNNVFLVGRQGTFATQDTGGDPINWPPLQLVDGKRGTVSFQGFDVSPSGRFVWIADISGLYRFDGSSYEDIPVSYYQAETWARINWMGAPHKVKVVDYAAKNRVVVLAPLDGATEPSHFLVWDYSRGQTPNSVRFSIWSIGASFNPGSICVVNNYNDPYSGAYAPPGRYLFVSNRQDLNTNILDGLPTAYSAFTANGYRDKAASESAIDSIYETALFGAGDGVQQHHGGHIDAHGAGTLNIFLKSKDGVVSKTLRTLTLAAAPDRNNYRGGHLLSEGSSYRFRVNTADHYFILNELTAYSSPYSLLR
ncbi:MAG TPA: hypothetical protein VFB63_32405 [Bryobacteraceae bacterium]|nr:hypothetical protein [Bryobacteraceae bacterium]